MDEQQPQPPKWAVRFFSWYCRNELREPILGDLEERYASYLEQHSKLRANWYYWMDVFRFINRFTLKRKASSSQLIPQLMLKNYAIVAFRNFARNKTFTGINIIGLSVSMAVCLLLILMINDQMSYDDFHANRDNTYRVYHKSDDMELDLPLATTPLPLGEKLKYDFTGLKDVVRFRRGVQGEIIDNGKAIGINGLFTDPEFFDLFDFELRLGNKESALTAPYSIVLKSEIAEKLFQDENPLGKTLDIEELGQFTITGVLDQFPGKSHMSFEALASFSTVRGLEQQEVLTPLLNDWSKTSSAWVYFRMEGGDETDALKNYLTQLAQENYDETSEFRVDFYLQKMADITPGPLMGNQIGQAMPFFFVYGLVLLAFLIMVCSAFNYANLTMARALTRFKEVGIRKVMGSTRPQLIVQFVVEAIIVCLLSLALAIGLLMLLIPAFEALTLSSLLSWKLEPNAEVYFQFLLFSLGTGLITGILPALYLSAAQPIRALKGDRIPKLSRLNMRKSLIVVQLVISIVLITSSALVYRQIKFMVEKDYGFAQDNIVNIDLQGQDYALFRAELDELSFVSAVSGTNNIPSIGRHFNEKVKHLPTDEAIDYNYFAVDEDYIDNLELKLIAGRNFTPNQPEEREIILNEAAVESFGFGSIENAIGQNLILEDSTTVNVVGVVQDYNFMMLYMEIKPLLLRYYPEDFSIAQVKLSGGNNIESIITLEEVWDTFDPNHDFEYKYFNEEIAEFYGFFYDIVYIIGLISILSASIAAMGLFGIATYSIQTRLKEVGIRKILGASSSSIVYMLGKGFMILILISSVIGGALSYFGNQAWLDLFAYRVNFGLDVLGIAFLFISVIGALTIGFQALRATATNPSEILRNE
ncbi:MAG: ABC transporter permease [Cyclobacteriaceae bacterium]